MMPVPFFQVVEFLDWLTTRHPQISPEGLSTGRLYEMALQYLRSGAGEESWTVMLGLGREREVEPSHVLKSVLRIFQTCTMINEPNALEQMAHFARCGQCMGYIQRERLDPRKAELHPFLQGFLRFSEERGQTQLIRDIAFRLREQGPERDEEIFGYLIQQIGPHLLETFANYLQDEALAKLASDYVENRRQLMMSTKRGERGTPPTRGRQFEDDGTQPLGENEDTQTSARRLAESVRFLVEGSFYQEQVSRNREVQAILRAAQLWSANTAQAIEFIWWLQEKHPNLDILASAPTNQIQELATLFCEEREYRNVASFSKDVLKWLRGEGDRGVLQRLAEVSQRIRYKNKTYRSNVSTFKRYQTIPYHAIFLFLSAGDFPTFIRTYWEDLNYLTGDYLDVYYSYEDIERKVSAFEVLNEFRTLQVQPTALPAILLWKKSLSESGVIPLQRLSHEDVFDVAKLVVQRIKEGKDVQEICIEGRTLVQEKTEALLPSTKIIIEKGEVTMGDKIVTGDNINIGGVQNVGKFHDVVASLNTAGQTELANALSELRQAISASPNLTDSQKQEQGDVINTIGEEAAKPKPNKTLLKMLGDGLMATLKSITDIAKAATALAPLLSKLIA